MRAPAHLVSSVCVGVCRYLAFGSWPRRWRARDEGQGCEAPAKPACAERTSLTRVSRSPKLAVRSEMAHRTTSDRSSSYFYISVSRSRARLPDAARFRARSTSHPVAARDGCTNIPLAAGRGSGERNHSSNRHFRPWTTSVRPPGSPELIRSWRFANLFSAYRQATFITAPSMTTPAVTYFHSATKSLRARATMIVFFMRPPLRLTRSLNHRASADCG
jgi:hypothetical protein